MNPEQLDLLRESILQLCRASNQFGLRPDVLLRKLQLASWDIDQPALAAELHHLKSSNLIVEADPAHLTPALVSYKTTHHGNHFLERRGLLP